MSGILPLTNLLMSLGVTKELSQTFGEAYHKFFPKYQINTPIRISAFFGNVLLECDYFRRLSENLNYSAQGLANTWPSRYSVTGSRPFKPNDTANRLNRKPELIANNCYSNRMGNGSESSGDGWKYRGRGPIQTTGKNGYKRVKDGTGLDVINNPDLLTTVNGGSEASCFYWKDNNLNVFADKNDFDGVCDLINIGKKTTKIGDSIHYTHRLSIFNKAIEWFKNHPSFNLDNLEKNDATIEQNVVPAKPIVSVNIDPKDGWVVDNDNGPLTVDEEEIINKDLGLMLGTWRPSKADTENIKLY